MSMFSMPDLSVSDDEGQPAQAPCILSTTCPVSSSKPCMGRYQRSQHAQLRLMSALRIWEHA